LNGANNNGVAQACKVRKRLDVSFAARLFNLLLFMAFIAALLHCCTAAQWFTICHLSSSQCFMLVQALGVPSRLGGTNWRRQYHFFLFFRQLVDAFSYSVCLARILLWFISTQPSGMTEAV
jgi:hypothetical protein